MEKIPPKRWNVFWSRFDWQEIAGCDIFVTSFFFNMKRSLQSFIDNFQIRKEKKASQKFKAAVNVLQKQTQTQKKRREVLLVDQHTLVPLNIEPL